MGTFPNDTVDGTIGSLLRETRERKGISLDEAARVTRIGKNYLSALENDAHDKLPNPAYVKGFLRIYAGFLGLSGDPLVARYDRDRGAPPPVAPEKAKPAPPKGDAPRRPKGRFYIPLLLFGLVMVASLFFGEKERPKPPRPAAPLRQAAPAPVQAVVTSASAAMATPPVPAPAQNTEERAPVVDATNPTGVILKLKVNQDSLLTITIDNNFSQQYDLKAGDLIEWKGERMFTLDLSNGGGVEAELNGKQLPPFGPSGKPAHAVVKPEDR